MLIFYLERHERLFRGLFEIQTENEKIENFGPKPWTNHFGEIQILPLFNLTFDRLKRLISYFWPKPWTNSLAKSKFLQCFSSTFLSSRKAYFLSRTSRKTFSGPIWPKKHRIKKMQILDQNHRLTPYQKCKFFHFLNSTFSSSKKANFLSRTPWKTFYGPISSKKQRINKMQIFDRNYGLTP